MKKIIEALKIEEIRKRLIFMFFAMVIIRFGAQIPLPGVSTEYFAE